jgi:membrane protein YqaA with SNARE-associated domain/membrane-associated phospholipid phosphatase
MQVWSQHMLIFLAHYGVIGLFTLSFVEASFFPLPPYVLLIPMTLAAPQLGPFYALVGTAGSILGGVFGYVIGFRVGRPILTHLFKNRSSKMESLFLRYGGWGIAIGGLTPIPYKIFAIMAGVFQMPVFTFITTSAIARSIHFFSGALLLMFYGPKVVGYLHHSFSLHTFIIVGIIVLIVLIFWHTKLVQQHLIPLLIHLRVVWQQGAAKVDTTTETLSHFSWFLIAGATLIIFSIGFFVKLAHELLQNELGFFDQRVGAVILSWRTSWLTPFMKGLTNLGSSPVIILIIVLVTIFGILYRRFLIDGIVLDICVGGGMGLTEILKAAFERARPPLPWLGIASGYSFPSGHALLTMTVYGFLAYLAVRYKENFHYSVPLAFLLILSALGVGLSRVYLGVHYPSDVVAGWAIAAAWVSTCIAGREILWKAELEQRKLVKK